MKKTFIYHHCNNIHLDLQATLYSATTPEKKGLILYFHGGGLIYGYRDDLPKVYIDMLNKSGYSLLSLDYPFIPEVKIDTIMDSLVAGIKKIKELPDLKNEPLNQLIYFGRSAGAYLALQLACHNDLTTPKKIISFYGYYSLEEPLLTISSSYYKSFPAVAFMTTHALIKKKPLVKSPIEDRFPIYLSYRQTGRWTKEILGQKNKASQFSLTKDDLIHFPPTFIAASENDQDIPFCLNEQLNDFIPDTTTFFVKDLPHDFDSDYQLSSSISCYNALINWLSK